VRACHRRGAHAIGGMAAFIPSRDATFNEQAFARVREDKEREAGQGFDGTWVAHPGLVPLAREIFDAVLGDRPNQKSRLREDVTPDGAALLALDRTPGAITLAGVQTNVSVGLRYLDSWLSGVGAAAIDNLMEDAATAEISRAQLWQWIRHACTTSEGETITPELYARERDAVLARLAGDGRAHLGEAAEILDGLVLDEGFAPFLTLRAGRLLP
jgi:malate synthase